MRVNIKFLFIIPLTIVTQFTQAQVLDIYTCLDSSEKNMPLLRQQPLMQSLLDNQLNNFSKAYLPTINLTGQTSYQSDVPELPFVVPGSAGLDIPHAQFRAYVEVTQPLLDAGVSKAIKHLTVAQTETNLKALELAAHEYKKQVAKVYFQLLLVGEQQKIVVKTLDLLRQREVIIKDALESGVSQQNDLLKLQSELLQLEGKLDALANAKMSGLQVLSLLTGIDAIGRELEIPEIQDTTRSDMRNNLDLQFFESQQKSLMAGESMINAQRKPRISAFGQLGVGAPNPYNIFQNTTSSFYMAGIRASWNIWDWGKSSVERQNLQLKNQMIFEQQSQKAIEIESKISKMRLERERLFRTLERGNKMVQLRTQIRKNAQIQLDEGIITTMDYLTEVLNEQVAELNVVVDNISFHQNSIMLQFETGILN